MDQYQCRGKLLKNFQDISPYEFPQEKVWTNGAQSSLKVSVLTGIGPYSALPCSRPAERTYKECSRKGPGPS